MSAVHTTVDDLALAPDVRIELISTSSNPYSTSRELLEQVAAALGEAGCTARLTDARTFPTCLAGVDEPSPEHFQLMEQIRTAAGVVIAYGIHGYSVPGATKNLIDLIGGSLADKPVAFVTAAGSERSHLAIRDLAASVVLENGSIWFPSTIQVCSRSGDESSEAATDRLARVGSFAAAFSDFAALLSGVHRS